MAIKGFMANVINAAKLDIENPTVGIYTESQIKRT